MLIVQTACGATLSIKVVQKIRSLQIEDVQYLEEEITRKLWLVI